MKKKTAINAYVTSIIDQHNSLLIGCSEYLISKIQKVQNAAAKLIYRAKKHDHVTNLLQELHWLPIIQRIKFKILVMTFKALNNETAPYIKDLLKPYIPARTLRSANEMLLEIPKTKFKSIWR